MKTAIELAEEAGLEWCNNEGCFFQTDKEGSGTEALERLVALVHAERRMHERNLPEALARAILSPELAHVFTSPQAAEKLANVVRETGKE